jgi:cysteinyl-tRNA synthetase
MTLRIYNTLSRKTEPFEPLEAGRVRMYVCGPTVYAEAHIGHAMSTVVFDVIRRFLEYRGYQVQHVMNYTDVEDKIIRRAAELGVAPEDLARGHQRAFERHLQDLNVEMPAMRPQASQEIPTIIEMIQRLIDAGLAYPVQGDVYFRVKRDPDYGPCQGGGWTKCGPALAWMWTTQEDRRLRSVESRQAGEPSWPSHLGSRAPGWHIECSAMNLRYLGEQIDLHGGGNDLIFPHHENEIAQTESLTGKLFARYWVHNGMLQLKGEKMSKSLGNLVTVEAFLARHEADAFRMMVLNSHYRGPLTYTEEVAEQAQAALERMRSALRPARPQDEPAPAAEASLRGEAETARKRFVEAMEDDFNTPAALAALFDLVRAINQGRDAGLAAESLAIGQRPLLELAGVLGLRLDRRLQAAGDSAPYIQLLVEIRDELRKARQWELADRIRDRLADSGIGVEDDPAGTRWERR